MNTKQYTLLYILLLLLSSTAIQTKNLKKTPIFQTIDQIKAYAKTHPEYPDIDNNNWSKPDYTSFYQNNIPSRADRTFTFLRLKKQPLWDAIRFKKLLKHVTHERENNGYVGRIVQRIEPEPGAKFIVWGNIFGAFHSLTRSLEYLQKKGIIDKKLKITDKKTYFVFKGNVIDLSPYILETLTLVLKLMEINPTNVIYLRGLHEEKETWLHFGLKKELEIKAQNVSDEKIPLKKDINRLFQTLPLALFITETAEDKPQAIRLSYTGMKHKELNPANFPELFEDNISKGTTKIFNLKNAKKTNKKPIQVRSIIKSPHKKPIPPAGFLLDGADSGAYSFLLFSSPSKTFRAMHKFFYDAFCIIKVKESFKDWTITFYNQDIREKLGIHKVETYNLFTGNIVSDVYVELQQQVKTLEEQLKSCQTRTEKAKKIAPPPTKLPKKRKVIPKKKPIKPKKIIPDKKKIVIGSTVDTTGHFSKIGNSIKKGLYAAIRNVRLLEDEGTAGSISKNINTLIDKYNANIILCPLVMASPEILQKYTTEVLFLFTQPSYSQKDVINFGPTCQEIAQMALKYAIEKERVQKFAFFYQKDILDKTVKDIIKKLDKNTYITIPYRPKKIQLENLAKKIRIFRPAALFLWGITPTTAKKIIKQIGPINLTDTVIIGYQLGTPTFKTYLEETELIRQYVGIETVPNPKKSNLEIMKQYRESINAADVDIFSAQAYICAQLYKNITKQVKGPTTKQAIKNVAESIKNYEFKGLTLQFNPTNRALSNIVWIDSGKDKWERYELKKTKPKKTATDTASRSIRENEIVFGTTMDLRGHLRGASKKTRFAIKRVFDLENQKGGINGKKLQLISENDDYKPKKARINVEKMLEEKNIDVILDPIGGPTTQAYLDLVEKGEILVLFPSTGAPVLRNPKLKYMINFRPSYKNIHIAAVKYVKENEGAKKFAFVFQEGATSGRSVKLAIEKNNISKNDYIEVPYSRGQISFEKQAKKILEFEPDVVAFWCQSVVLSKIIEKIGAPNLKNKILLTTEMGSLAALKYMKKIGLLENFINTENVPSPAKSQLKIMKQYREDLKAPDNFLAETYISTKYLIEILKKIEAPITKEKIIAAMEATKNYNLGGFTLNFDPQTRQLSNQIWIYKAGREIGKISTEL